MKSFSRRADVRKRQDFCILLLAEAQLPLADPAVQRTGDRRPLPIFFPIVSQQK
jgi:hypothetical protein